MRIALGFMLAAGIAMAAIAFYYFRRERGVEELPMSFLRRLEPFLKAILVTAMVGFALLLISSNWGSLPATGARWLVVSISCGILALSWCSLLPERPITYWASVVLFYSIILQIIALIFVTGPKEDWSVL